MAKMDELAWLDAAAQADLVRRGEVKPIELVDAAIERIERLNPAINAVITPMYEQARTLAMSELPDGPLTGVPFLLKDLIADAGVDPNATTVIFYAYDGYSTSLPLDYIIGNNILIAYKMNNVTLPPERGFPFQLVAESKWGYKWIKWITAIELSDNEEYRGYWESRGYSNNAALSEGFFESGIPEFTSWIFIPLLIVAIVIVIIYRNKLHKNPNKQS